MHRLNKSIFQLDKRKRPLDNFSLVDGKIKCFMGYLKYVETTLRAKKKLGIKIHQHHFSDIFSFLKKIQLLSTLSSVNYLRI